MTNHAAHKPGQTPSSGSAELNVGDVQAVVRAVLRDVLTLNPKTASALTSDSGLFGELPELDSMAVAGLLTELEDRLSIIIDDEEVDGDMFATFGALVDFAKAKVAAKAAG